jgi:hypothetical protein
MLARQYVAAAIREISRHAQSPISRPAGSLRCCLPSALPRRHRPHWEQIPPEPSLHPARHPGRPWYGTTRYMTYARAWWYFMRPHAAEPIPHGRHPPPRSSSPAPCPTPTAPSTWGTWSSTSRPNLGPFPAPLWAYLLLRVRRRQPRHPHHAEGRGRGGLYRLFEGAVV